MALTRITTDGITDGSILNADINSSAAIALSKLSTSGTASGSTYLRGDGAWSAVSTSDSTKMPLAGGTFTGDVIWDSQTNAGRDMTWDESESDLTFNDAAYIQMGNTNDLTIGHNGSYSFLTQTGSKLVIGSGGNYAVEMLYGNTKRFETTSAGVEVNGTCTATTFIGPVTGNASSATSATTTVNVNLNDESSDTSCYLTFATGDSGTLPLKTGSNLTFNSSSGALTATSFVGALTGNAATATALATARTIAGVSFDGTGNISLNNNAITNGASYITASNAAITNKMPLAGGSFVGDVLFDNQSNAGKDIFWDESADYLNFKDNVHATFGDGSDLRIYHDGSHNILLGVNGADLKIKDASNNSAIFDTSAGVELFYANSKKFETTSNGISVTGTITASSNINIGDSDEFIAGDGNDLRLWHNGTDSYIKNYTGDLYIQGDGDDLFLRASDNITLYTQTSDNAVNCTGDAGVELYYDNSKKFETQSAGVEITGKLTFSTEGLAGGSIDLGIDADLNLYHDNSDAYFDNNVGDFYIRNDGSSTSEKIRIQAKGGEQSIVASPNGAVELYSNNRLSLATQTNGIQVTSADSEATLRIKSLSQDGGSTLEFISDNGDDHADFWRIRADGGGTALSIQNYADSAWEANIVCRESDNVELRFDNSKKLETTSSGATVTGDFRATGNLVLADSSGGSNNRIVFGAGADLNLYSDGSTSLIEGNDIRIRNANGDENLAIFTNGDSVELYYDGSKKFQTTSVGAHVWGNLDFMDNAKVRLGTNTDLQIYHSSSSGNNIYQGASHEFWNAAGNEPLAKLTENGSVELYHDGVKRFETVSDGVKVTAPEGGIANLYIHGDEGDDNADQYRLRVPNNDGFYIQAGSGNENALKIDVNAGVYLYFDDVLKFETNSSGAKVSGGFQANGAAADGNSTCLTMDYASNTGRIMGHGSGGGELAFFTNPSGGGVSERMRINSSGRVRMPVVYSTAGSSMRDVQIESNGTLCGQSSIRAAKTNIAEITDVNWIYDLKPISFNFRKHTVNDDGTNTYLDEAETEKAHGLIAEEVEAVNKDFCFYDKDKDGKDVLAGVYYKTLISPLIKVVQEQKKEIDTLKTKVAALGG